MYTPIADHRKITIDLVLVPFLIVIKGLSFNETYQIIVDWVLKCNSSTRLEPSIEYFEGRIQAAIIDSVQNKIPPMTTRKMQTNYPDW